MTSSLDTSGLDGEAARRALNEAQRELVRSRSTDPLPIHTSAWREVCTSHQVHISRLVGSLTKRYVVVRTDADAEAEATPPDLAPEIAAQVAGDHTRSHRE